MDMNDVETIAFTRPRRRRHHQCRRHERHRRDAGQDRSGRNAGGPGGDGAADKIVINGTGGDDVITLSLNSNGALVINGLASQVVIENFDFNDTITINGLGGNDVIEASGIGPGGPHLVFDGGAGDDVLIGSAGDDTLLGGLGDDVLLGGGGLDVLDGGPGGNVVIQSLVANATFHELLV